MSYVHAPYAQHFSRALETIGAFNAAHLKTFGYNYAGQQKIEDLETCVRYTRELLRSTISLSTTGLHYIPGAPPNLITAMTEVMRRLADGGLDGVPIVDLAPDPIGAPVRPIELVDARLYHLDLTFCPLDDRHAICAPTGWDQYGCRVVAEDRGSYQVVGTAGELMRRQPRHRPAR